MQALLTASHPDTGLYHEDEPRHGRWPSARHLARVAGAAHFVARLDPEERQDALPGLMCLLQATMPQAMLEEIARALGHLAALDAARSDTWQTFRTGWLAGRDLSGIPWHDASAPVMLRLLEVLSRSAARSLPPRHQFMGCLREVHADSFDATMLAQLAPDGV